MLTLFSHAPVYGLMLRECAARGQFLNPMEIPCIAFVVCYAWCTNIGAPHSHLLVFRLYDAPISVHCYGHDGQGRHEHRGGLAGAGQLAQPKGVRAEGPNETVQDLSGKNQEIRRTHRSSSPR